jgi:hypothetical protein
VLESAVTPRAYDATLLVRIQADRMTNPIEQNAYELPRRRGSLAGDHGWYEPGCQARVEPYGDSGCRDRGRTHTVHVSPVVA